MRTIIKIIFFCLIMTHQASADEVTSWLKKEIDVILNSYKNDNLSSEVKFLAIEDTINFNFAGKGIAKFVSGDSWKSANKSTKKEYIDLFKRHLALNIASMMQGYSNQKYQLINSKYDSKNKVSLIDMEIFSETGTLTITWRVKKSKDRFYIIDLLVADISLVVTKRSEFNSMLRKVNNNLQELNISLRQQNKESYNKIIN